MKVYTRSGDKGTTRIRGGQRIAKDDSRIIANGTLDELNAVIGVVKAYLPSEHPWQEILLQIQEWLMPMMSQVATPSALREQNPNRLPEQLDVWCEKLIYEMEMELKDAGCFVLPGGSLVSAHLQWARTIVRRAETQLWRLHREDPLPEELMRYVNRLSDLFFIMARLEVQRNGGKEEKWKEFRNKPRP